MHSVERCLPAAAAATDVTPRQQPATLTSPWWTPTGNGDGSRRATPRSTAHPVVPRDEECWPVTLLMDRYPALRFERWLPAVLRSIKRASGAVFDDRLLRGPRGHPLCLWCSQETPTSRALFCATPSGRPYLETEFGEGCEHEHRMRRDNQYVRKQLFLRDGGACYDCGVDAHALYAQAVACESLDQRTDMFRQLAQRAPEWQRKVKMPLASLDHDFTEGMFWEAAHKIDVKHGGGLCGLDGFLTMCVPCHSDEYMRNYMADISSMSLFQSPTSALSDTDRSGLLSTGRASCGLPSVPRDNRPRYTLSPVQSICSAASDICSVAPSSVILLETSPVCISTSPSPSSMPSPGGVVSMCLRPRRPLQETPTKAPPSNASNLAGTIRCRQTETTAKHGAKTPSKPTQAQLAAIIDLTTLVREPTAQTNRRPELESLASILTTVNISSSEEQSSDEIEMVHEAPKRLPLATHKHSNTNSKQGECLTLPTTKAKGCPSATSTCTAICLKEAGPSGSGAKESSAPPCPRLAQKSISENMPILRRSSRVRMPPRPTSCLQENSPAAHGLPARSGDSTAKQQGGSRHSRRLAPSVER